QDSDGDGYGDACDKCTGPGTRDDDNDGHCDDPPTCGNGLTEPGEACDGGQCCTPECRFVLAGVVCGCAVPPCDPTKRRTGTSGGCPIEQPDDRCASICGDGVVDPGEACDDGNNENGDGCEADCTISHGILPRSTLPHGALPASPSSCGNGRLDPGEACDDGNNQDGDGCEADCTLPRPAPPPPGVAPASLPCPADALAGIQCELARAPLDSCPGGPASGPFKDFLSQWETSIRLALAAAEDHADATTGRD